MTRTQSLKDYYLEKMKVNIELLRKVMVRNDLDFILACVGFERVGKSTLSMWLAYLFDPNFDVKKQVVFTIEDLYRAVYTLPKHSCIVCDEMVAIAMNREAMTSKSRELVKLLAVCGERNMFIILNIPSFELLDPYLRKHRLAGLCRVTSRGNFRFYSKRRLKQSYFNPKVKAWNWAKENFKDRFPKMTGELWEEYVSHKHEHMKKRKSEWLDNIDADIEKTYGLTVASKRLHMNRSTLQQWCIKGKAKASKNPAGIWFMTGEEIDRLNNIHTPISEQPSRERNEE